MRISDWSSDVCSSDLQTTRDAGQRAVIVAFARAFGTLVLFPSEGLRIGIGDRRLTQHVRMPGLHLVADGSRNLAEVEMPLTACHLFLGHHFQQPVAQLITHITEINPNAYVGTLSG